MNEIEQLKAENKWLKKEKENLIEQLVIYNQFENSYNKYRTTLQEIKAIAEDRTKTYDYLLGQEYTELVDKILDLITKAEEE